MPGSTSELRSLNRKAVKAVWPLSVPPSDGTAGTRREIVASFSIVLASDSPTFVDAGRRVRSMVN